MDAKVSWHAGLSFTGASDSGFQLPLGTDKSVGGNDDGFRPMELFAIGLAGCTAMDVISIMLKKRQDVTDFEVKVHVDRANQHPKVFTQGVIEYILTGRQIDETALQRSIELSAAAYCPAQAMLGKIMPIELKYTIYEDLGDGQRSLVKSAGLVVA